MISFPEGKEDWDGRWPAGIPKMPDDVLCLQKCRHASQNRLSKAISTNVLPSLLATFGVQGLSFIPSIDKLKNMSIELGSPWKSLDSTPSHPTAEQEA